jgi:hypothetical protein
MTGLFQSRREDGRADWRVAYDLIKTRQRGETITLEELAKELDTEDRGRISRAVIAARKRLWKHDQMSVDSVRGEGYRILQPNEHTDQALEIKMKASRQLDNSVMASQSTDLLALSQEERETAINVRGALMALADAVTKTALKVQDHEARIRRLEESPIKGRP